MVCVVQSTREYVIALAVLSAWVGFLRLRMKCFSNFRKNAENVFLSHFRMEKIVISEKMRRVREGKKRGKSAMGNLHKNAQSDLCVLNNMYRGIFYVVYMKQKYHFLLCFPSTVSPWWLLFPTLLHHQLNSVLCIFLILFSVHNPLFPSSHDHKSQYQAQCKMFSCPVLENFSICCFFFGLRRPKNYDSCIKVFSIPCCLSPFPKDISSCYFSLWPCQLFFGQDTKKSIMNVSLLDFSTKSLSTPHLLKLLHFSRGKYF